MSNKLNDIAREAAALISKICMIRDPQVFDHMESNLKECLTRAYNLDRPESLCLLMPVQQSGGGRYEFEGKWWEIESWQPRPPKKGEVYMSHNLNKPVNASFDFHDQQIILRPVAPVEKEQELSAEEIEWMNAPMGPPAEETGLEEKKAFLKLPMDERRKILAEQVDRFVERQTAEAYLRTATDIACQIFHNDHNVACCGGQKWQNIPKAAALITAYAEKQKPNIDLAEWMVHITALTADNAAPSRQRPG